MQEFGFNYLDGDLFFDRAGEVARKLRSKFPGIARNEHKIYQRIFNRDLDKLVLLYGHALSEITCFADAQKSDFATKAGVFLNIICGVLELESLLKFQAKVTFGFPCQTLAEAKLKLQPSAKSENLTNFSTLMPNAELNSVAVDFMLGSFDVATRMGIKLDPDNVDDKTALLTFEIELEGKDSIPVADFDIEAFWENFIQNTAKEIVAKLAPQLLK